MARFVLRATKNAFWRDLAIMRH